MIVARSLGPTGACARTAWGSSGRTKAAAARTVFRIVAVPGYAAFAAFSTYQA